MLNDCVFTLCNKENINYNVILNCKCQQNHDILIELLLFVKKKGGVDFYVATDCRTVEKGVVE